MKYLFRMWVCLVVMLGLQVGFGSDAVAQSMTMTLDGEVVLQPQDMDATSYSPVRDANDNLCALLKVTVTNKLKNPLALETGGLSVEKREEQLSGEIWFWVPYQVKNLQFRCQDYKTMSPIPVRLEKGKVYRLTLRTDAQVKSFTDVVENFNFLKIQVLPEEAVGAFVSVGRTQNYEVEAKYTQEGGLYTSSLPLDYGEYFYKIEHEHYETLEGRVQLTATTPKQTVTLRPAYGVLKITSEPSGAVVAIDGKRVGTTPWTSAKLARGTVQMRLQSPQYALYEETVQVLGNGQVQSHHCKLVPQFGTITCRSEMADAEIWVDQEYKGVGSWTGTLSSQAPHVLEARKSGHQSQSISFTVANGEKKTEVVGAPVPMYGTLVLSTTPADVRVSIDGQTMGETPLVQRLLVGKHTVVLKKGGYEDLSFEVTVAHNQRLDEKRTLAKRQLVPQFGTVTCRSEMADAEIWVDQEYKGVGSWTGTLSSQAAHLLEARKAGHKAQSISFSVASGETKTEVVKAPVPMYGTLVLSSTPAGCLVTMDGSALGETPLVQQVLVGTHSIELKKDGYQGQSFEVTIEHNQRLDEKRTLAKRQLASKQAGPGASLAADFVIEMVYVEGGTFQMGATKKQDTDAQENEKPVHSVTLSDFYIGKYEVTQAQWKAVMGKNPSYFTGEDNRPVEYVSWEDVQEFIQKLNALTGKTYRLPTEAEWEYAARGGKKSQGYKYAGNVAWYSRNSGMKTHPVGQGQPNELGLYDMSGNVREWCQDWYGSYDSSAQTNPTGPSSGTHRVLRGGDWASLVRACRVACRNGYDPSSCHSTIGFRLVLLP